MLAFATRRKLSPGASASAPPADPTPDAPGNLSATPDGTGDIDLVAGAVTGVDYYSFYRSDSLVGVKTKLTTDGVTTSPSFTDETATGTDPWVYWATASVTVGLVTFESDFSPSASAALPDTPGVSLTLGATFETIDIEVPYEADGTPSATLRVSPNGSDWTACLPLWPVDDGAGYSAFVGSIPLRAAGTEYTVEVTASGVAASGVSTGTVTTRAENIVALASLTATHTLKVTGGDFASVKDAIDFFNDTPNSHMRVECDPGFWPVYGRVVQSGTGGTLTFFNKTTPAAVDAVVKGKPVAVEANVGNQTIFGHPNPVSGASGTAWVLVDDTVGPTTSTTYNLWRFTNPSGAGQVKGVTYCDTETGIPIILSPTDIHTQAANLPTLGHMAEWLYENPYYNYGWFIESSTSQVIYVRMPDDADPNDSYMRVVTDDMIDVRADADPHALTGATVRFAGIRFQGALAPLSFRAPANYGVVDHCVFDVYNDAAVVIALRSPSVVFGHDHVFERNVMRARGLRAEPGVDANTRTDIVPFGFIKNSNVTYLGVKINKPGSSIEGAAISGTGGSRRLVFRHNHVDGLFNGLSVGVASAFGRYASSCYDVYENLFENICDDACGEHEPNNMNFRFWNNRLEYISVWITCNQGNYGPQYYWGNEIYEFGCLEVAGQAATPLDRGVTPTLIKANGAHPVTPRLYLINNTAYSSQSLDGPPGPTGNPNKHRPRVIHQTNGGSTGTKPDYYLRNNLFVLTGDEGRIGRDESSVDATRYDEDANGLFAVEGHHVGGTLYTTIASYRDALNDGDNTNQLGTAGADLNFTETTTAAALFTDAATGDLSVLSGSPAEGYGVAVPILADAGCDLGAGGAN